MHSYEPKNKLSEEEFSFAEMFERSSTPQRSILWTSGAANRARFFRNSTGRDQYEYSQRSRLAPELHFPAIMTVLVQGKVLSVWLERLRRIRRNRHSTDAVRYATSWRQEPECLEC